MSAETLRRAAALMRERAEAATDGPWRVCGEGSEGSRIAPDYDSPERGKRERARFIGILNGRVQPEDGHNARHIASWHPAVALAVADWLDGVATEMDRRPIKHTSRALAVARAYLGEQS